MSGKQSSRLVKSLTHLHWKWSTEVTTCVYPQSSGLTIGSRIAISLLDRKGNKISVCATIKMMDNKPYTIGNQESKDIRKILVKAHPNDGHQYHEITKLDTVPMYWIEVDGPMFEKCILGTHQVIFIDSTNAAIYCDAEEQIDYHTNYSYRMTGKALWSHTTSSIFRVNCDDNKYRRLHS